MKRISIIALVFVIFTYAQPSVKMQSHVQAYLQGNNGKHRSGLASARDYGSNFEEFREGERIQLVSFDDPLLQKKSFHEIKNIISKDVSKNFQSINYYDNVVRLDSYKGTFKVDILNLKKNQYQESKKMLRHLFSDSIAKQFDLFVIGTEYISSENIPQTENGYELLFQRVYNGRIIRSLENYLNIAVDKDGRIKNMEMAWQDLFPTEKITSINNNLTEIIGALEQVAKSDYSSVVVIGDGTADTLNIKNLYVNGVAKAWCKIVVESKKVLFPCLSYSVDIEDSNGEIKSTVIDAPYSINYQKEFMGIAKLQINRKQEVK